MSQHGAVASRALCDERLVQAALEDWRTAPIPEPLRLTMGFLEKLTLAPASVGPDDVVPLRAAGLSDEAIEDAIQICANMNIMNRLGDALGFEASQPDSLARYASLLLRLGYH
jgi:uncharacterized peroxidase-related enzyme